MPLQMEIYFLLLSQTGRSQRYFFSSLSAIFVNCLQLKIILMPKKRMWVAYSGPLCVDM